jgi:AcrR family transcriptional regulator
MSRSLILDAAVACLTQFGNDKTTLNDVARAAGLSRQTVYRYFPDRGALLEAVQEMEEQRLRDEVATIGARAASLEEFLRALIGERAATVARYRTREHLLAQDRSLQKSLSLSNDRWVVLLREVIEPQLETRRGELRPDIDVGQAAEWAAIIVSGLPTLRHAATFDLDDPAEVAGFFSRHICRGLVKPWK